MTIRGFFPGEGEDGKPLAFEKKEPSWRMWVPMVILAALSVLLGLFPNALIDFFTGIAGTVL